MHAPAPRHYTAQASLLAGVPMQDGGADREARIESRRAFAALKRTFLAVVADLQDRQADWLRAQVRSAELPVDLWLLRAPLFEALSGTDPERRRRRQLVRRSLESMFHDSEPQPAVSAFTAF
jgi:hypothetical protein